MKRLGAGFTSPQIPDAPRARYVVLQSTTAELKLRSYGSNRATRSDRVGLEYGSGSVMVAVLERFRGNAAHGIVGA